MTEATHACAGPSCLEPRWRPRAFFLEMCTRPSPLSAEGRSFEPEPAINNVDPRGIADGDYTLTVKGQPRSLWEHDKYGWKRL